jgi:hypothetical protein
MYTRLYEEFFRAVKIPGDLIASATDATGPLAAATVRDVYAFGVFFGHLVGRLFALPAAEIGWRAEWCGRFNLGISLFDYLSDEAGQDADLFLSPPFNRLLPRPPTPSTTAGPPCQAEQLLRQIATDVMAKLETEVGPLERRDRMWQTLVDMMRAETLMSQARLEANPDIAGLLEAAESKSAGPFLWMAEWMTLGRTPASRENARDLGAAIGNCYWLVDDARDLWDDLDAGRWNFFLLAAAKVAPELFANRSDPTVEIRLSRILMMRGWVKKAVAPVIARLHKQIARKRARGEIAGLLAVSMERWLR